MGGKTSKVAPNACIISKKRSINYEQYNNFFPCEYCINNATISPRGNLLKYFSELSRIVKKPILYYPSFKLWTLDFRPPVEPDTDFIPLVEPDTEAIFNSWFKKFTEITENMKKISCNIKFILCITNNQTSDAGGVTTEYFSKSFEYLIDILFTQDNSNGYWYLKHDDDWKDDLKHDDHLRAFGYLLAFYIANNMTTPKKLPSALFHSAICRPYFPFSDRLENECMVWDLIDNEDKLFTFFANIDVNNRDSLSSIISDVNEVEQIFKSKDRYKQYITYLKDNNYCFVRPTPESYKKIAVGFQNTDMIYDSTILNAQSMSTNIYSSTITYSSFEYFLTNRVTTNNQILKNKFVEKMLAYLKPKKPKEITSLVQNLLEFMSGSSYIKNSPEKYSFSFGNPIVYTSLDGKNRDYWVIKSHTCFNRLDIPYQIIKGKLMGRDITITEFPLTVTDKKIILYIYLDSFNNKTAYFDKFFNLVKSAPSIDLRGGEEEGGIPPGKYMLTYMFNQKPQELTIEIPSSKCMDILTNIYQYFVKQNIDASIDLTIPVDIYKLNDNGIKIEFPQKRNIPTEMVEKLYNCYTNQSQGGKQKKRKTPKRKTEEKIKIKSKMLCVYVGSKGGKYIKRIKNGKNLFLPISKL